jgi:hypothetical protein
MNGMWLVMLPELADIADTAFTNNHCFWYGGGRSERLAHLGMHPVGRGRAAH